MNTCCNEQNTNEQKSGLSQMILNNLWVNNNNHRPPAQKSDKNTHNKTKPTALKMTLRLCIKSPIEEYYNNEILKISSINMNYVITPIFHFCVSTLCS